MTEFHSTNEAIEVTATTLPSHASGLRTPPMRRSRPPRTTPRKWVDKLVLGNNNHKSNTGSRSSSSPSSHPTKSPSQQQQQQHHGGASQHHHDQGNINHKSWEETSDAGSVATPSSVLVKGYSLERDLSDLSGSYMNGNTAPRSTATATGSRCVSHASSEPSEISHHRPWMLARILSSREPLHPQPPTDCDDSIILVKKGLIAVDNTGDVEMFDVNSASYMPSSPPDHIVTRHHHQPPPRIPVILLLMDPSRKIYELLQIWIDPREDAVRDLLHVLKKNLRDSWRQDYDGIFQVRNNHFSQLIHILNIAKYDPIAGEILVAKPWSMSAKHTVGYASGLLNQLKHTGVITYQQVGPDAALALSTKAHSRIYVPTGILKHHHACQFLAFTPPFDGPVVRVDVLGGDDHSLVSEPQYSHLSDAVYTTTKSTIESTHNIITTGSRTSKRSHEDHDAGRDGVWNNHGRRRSVNHQHDADENQPVLIEGGRNHFVKAKRPAHSPGSVFGRP